MALLGLRRQLRNNNTITHTPLILPPIYYFEPNILPPIYSTPPIYLEFESKLLWRYLKIYQEDNISWCFGDLDQNSKNRLEYL